MKMKFLKIIALPIILASSSNGLNAATASTSVINGLKNGNPQIVTIEFNVDDINEKVDDILDKQESDTESGKIREDKLLEYRKIKQSIFSTFFPSEIDLIRELEQLPISHIKIQTLAALDKLLSFSRVKRVYENATYHSQQAQSLPQVNQPIASSMGLTGNGAIVAVIDTGVDFTRPTFGLCPFPGASTCQVILSEDTTTDIFGFVFDDGTMDDGNLHGTNVSAIVAGIGTGIRLAVFDAGIVNVNSNPIPALRSHSFSQQALEIAINRILQEKRDRNIVAVNMSLGALDTAVPSNQACNDGFLNSSVTELRRGGILPVIASGNDQSTNRLAVPACTPGAISVGAVYDLTAPQMVHSVCTTNNVELDDIACFSNSASNLSLLAPGSRITAAAITQSGTSQAAPHVAGAVALMRSANPNESLLEVTARLTGSSKSVLDTRNNVSRQRLDLESAINFPVFPRQTNQKVSDSFGSDRNWDESKYTRILVDINRDSLDDIVGFHYSGTYIAKANGNGYDTPIFIPEFGERQGWVKGNNPRYVADINGDSFPDIVGFGDNGVVVAMSNFGNSFATPVTHDIFTSAENWSTMHYPRMVADINGDLRADVIGFGYYGTYIAYSQLDDTFSIPTRVCDCFGYDNGWRVSKHFRLIEDVSGDDFPDIVGFGEWGVYVSIYNPSQRTFSSARRWSDDFGAIDGWELTQNPRFVTDVNGDNKKDIVGFGNDGVYVALSTGGSFEMRQNWLGAFSARNNGWDGARHERLMFDVDNDGLSDIIGFHDKHVWYSRATGSGFASPVRLAYGFGSKQGWIKNKHKRVMGRFRHQSHLSVIGFGESGITVTNQ